MDLRVEIQTKRIYGAKAGIAAHEDGEMGDMQRIGDAAGHRLEQLLFVHDGVHVLREVAEQNFRVVMLAEKFPVDHNEELGADTPNKNDEGDGSERVNGDLGGVADAGPEQHARQRREKQQAKHGNQRPKAAARQRITHALTNHDAKIHGAFGEHGVGKGKRKDGEQETNNEKQRFGYAFFRAVVEQRLIEQ